MWKQLRPENALIKTAENRYRTVSSVVISGKVTIPSLTQTELDNWSHQMASIGVFDKGDVAVLGDYNETPLITPGLQDSIDSWLLKQGITRETCTKGALPLACVGASFHHDGDSCPSQVFCIIWLAADTPWDLVFPFQNVRIPLEYGTIVLFDSAQPHGVVAAGATVFEPDSLGYLSGIFISQDLWINPLVQQVMAITVLPDSSCDDFVVINDNLYQEELNGRDGSWHVKPFPV